MVKKIIFCAGGTGGHIFPAISLKKFLKKQGYEILLVTDKRGGIFFKDDFDEKLYFLNTDSPINKNFFGKFFAILKICTSILKSIFILNKEKPNLIIGFGGYVSFPLSFLSKFFKIPLIIYENNLILGRANKKLLPIAKKILLGNDTPKNFPQEYENKIINVGNILREEIINFTGQNNNNSNFVILVLGGSQGAEIFGKVLPETIKMLSDSGNDIEIIQQCLEHQKKILTEFYNLNNIKNYIFDFKKDIFNLFPLADIAISRCGSSTTAELVQTQTPFIGVPYPYSMDNHQHLNAKYYEKKGCCLLVEQSNFNSENLFNLIADFIKNKNKLKEIRKNMEKNSNKDVYKNIEIVIKNFI